MTPKTEATQYLILHDNDAQALACRVSEWILDGWEPLGGVAVMGFPNTPNNREYSQAITKRQASPFGYARRLSPKIQAVIDKL